MTDALGRYALSIPTQDASTSQSVEKVDSPEQPPEDHDGEISSQRNSLTSAHTAFVHNNDELVEASSKDSPPPPLPPRPARATSPTGSLRPSKNSPRPQLLSKATTAVSLADFHQPRLEVSSRKPSVGSRATSINRGFSSLGRHSSRRGSVTEDSLSVRSYVPAGSGSGEIDSLLGGFSISARAEDHVGKDRVQQHEDENFLESLQEEDIQFEQYFEHEFDELESLASDGSNEESLMIRWRLKLKHFMILSSAGKPIYSRHGDDQLISNSIGVIQTILSIFINEDDSLKGFSAGDARFVVVSKGHLYLVAISRLGETDAHLRVQLEALYMQILSTLTLPTMERMFINRPSTDLRRPLEGTETLLAALADGFTRGSPSTLLSALESLMLRKTQRELINKTLSKCRSPSLLYGLIVAGRRLVSVIRPRKHSLHPGDLQLIFNMLFEAEGVRAGGGENWIPLCLPGFNNTGYLYMYVSFLRASSSSGDFAEQRVSAAEKEDEIAIILISANREGFFELRKMRDELVEELESNGAMATIRAAVRKGRTSCTDIAPGTVIRHFLYKSRANVQFTMAAPSPSFTALAWRKLITLYASLHAAVHGRNAHLKVHTATSQTYMALAWVTPLFEFYCVASATASRTALAQAAHKIVTWAKTEEQRLFVVGGAAGFLKVQYSSACSSLGDGYKSNILAVPIYTPIAARHQQRTPARTLRLYVVRMVHMKGAQETLLDRQYQLHDDPAPSGLFQDIWRSSRASTSEICFELYIHCDLAQRKLVEEVPTWPNAATRCTIQTLQPKCCPEGIGESPQTSLTVSYYLTVMLGAYSQFPLAQDLICSAL